ncbi:MAG: hypothetical protein JWQ02_1732, partial [Capsulimonas sp.]|nr:hypothetical protein [Capsulimonas sp.]
CSSDLGHVLTRRYYVAQHISVGTNDETRLIWNRTDGSAVLSRLSVNGAELGRRVLGTHAGKVIGIATAPSGVSSILWGEDNGAASLWTVNANYVVTKMVNYGPYDGWKATSVAVGGDGLPHLLWNRYDATAAIWQMSAAGDYLSDKSFSLPGFTVPSLAVGTDNMLHLALTRPNGETRLWTLSTTGNVTSQSTYPPLQDMKIKFITTDKYNDTWALWSGTNGCVVRTVSPNQQLIHISSGGAMTPEIGVGSDGYLRSLQTSSDGRSRLRIYDNSNAVISTQEFAPF